MESDRTTMKNIDALAWDPKFIKQLGVYPSPYHKYYYYYTHIKSYIPFLKNFYAKLMVNI